MFVIEGSLTITDGKGNPIGEVCQYEGELVAKLYDRSDVKIRIKFTKDGIVVKNQSTGSHVTHRHATEKDTFLFTNGNPPTDWKSWGKIQLD